MGLTENPSALRRWVVAGPEIARLVQEFEESNISKDDDTEEDTRHHEQRPGVQSAFVTDVKALVSTFVDLGNPFTEDSEDLIVLDSREVAHPQVVHTVNNILEIGQAQYAQYVSDRLDKCTKPITDPISRNNLPLFSRPPTRKPTKKASQLLFSRL